MNSCFSLLSWPRVLIVEKRCGKDPSMLPLLHTGYCIQIDRGAGVRGAHPSDKSLCRISLVGTEPTALSHLTLLVVKFSDLLSYRSL